MLSAVQANEINYELHSLGWKAFQNLSSTIMSEIWDQTIQAFFDSQRVISGGAESITRRQVVIADQYLMT